MTRHPFLPTMSEPDHTDFIRLFVAHQRELFAFVLAQGVRPSDADDILQDAAVVLWERFADFTPGSNFRAWAFAVLRRVLLANRRQRRRDLVLDPDCAVAVSDQMLTEAPTADPDLSGCIARLAPQERQLLELRYHEGLSPQAMAEQLGIAAGTLRVRLHRIRRQLGTCLAQQEGHLP